jgi:class 3 adenylate cyclase
VTAIADDSLRTETVVQVAKLMAGAAITARRSGRLDLIRRFMGAARPVAAVNRVLATVLFTDIVDSTGLADRLGDSAWRELLDRHDALMAEQLRRHRGELIKRTGDGVLATFDAPGRAVACAAEVCELVRGLGLEIRAGLHTGEVERRDGDIGGIAVHLAARVKAVAGPGEVVVTRTVTDLVVGSDLGFSGRGEHRLKGIDRPWELWQLTPPAAP